MTGSDTTAPVAAGATVARVPQKRGLINAPDQRRIRAALAAQQAVEDAKQGVDAELRAAVVTAAEHGSSVRELAAFTGLSTNTISRWKRGE
jgi:DNA-directed RNA polymerase specialized sigma24 family protein